MNLYCVSVNEDDYFFFEREDGEMAELTNRSSTYMSSGQNAIQEVKDNLQEKREQYGKVKMLLQQSMQAVEGMDDNNMSRKKLVKVVRDYHNDVCTDGSKCIVYEYNDKADKAKTHFKAFAGYAHYATEMVDLQQNKDMNYPGSTYEIGVGVEIELERIMKGLSIELELALTPKYKSSQDLKVFSFHKNATHFTYEKTILTPSLGAVKSWGQGKIQPIVRGGGFVADYRADEYRHNCY